MRSHPSPPCVRLPGAAWPAAVVLVLVLVFTSALLAGCGGEFDPASAPKTEAQREYETKVQSLVKQGKSFTEIRAIMRGETPKKPKKARGKRP
jgi:hypothetical protein